MLPTERLRFLAAVGRRSTSQALQRRDGDRRYPILLALVAQSAVDQLDEVVALFDQAVSARESRAKSKTDEALIDLAKKGEARHLLMNVILPVLADWSIPERGGGRPAAQQHRNEQAAGGGVGRMEAATPRPWPAVGDGLLVLVSAAVHPRCAVGDRFPGRAGHVRADGGGRRLDGAEAALDCCGTVSS